MVAQGFFGLGKLGQQAHSALAQHVALSRGANAAGGAKKQL